MKVSDSELKLLEVLWQQSPLTVGQVIQRVQINTKWHENTIKTLLMRLTKKQAVKRHKDGRRYFYQANVEKDTLLSEETQGFLAKFFGGRVSPFIAHFNKTNKLSSDEIKELEAILAKMKQEND